MNVKKRVIHRDDTHLKMRNEIDFMNDTIRKCKVCQDEKKLVGKKYETDYIFLCLCPYRSVSSNFLT